MDFGRIKKKKRISTTRAKIQYYYGIANDEQREKLYK